VPGARPARGPHGWGLTGCFTGGAAGGFPAILLSLDVAWVGDEKPLAVPALTSESSCHDSASPGHESKRSGAEKGTADREERRGGPVYIFKSPGSRHFQIAGDNRRAYHPKIPQKCTENELTVPADPCVS
jgi:hypothetical protein